jgi:hypothetical protein
MAETKRMRAEHIVSYLLEEEGLDFLRESLTWGERFAGGANAPPANLRPISSRGLER